MCDPLVYIVQWYYNVRRKKIKFVNVKIKTNQMHCYNFILQNFFYMFRGMKVHHQGVSCRIQTLWCNGLSKYIWYRSELSMCVTYKVE